eukprot:361817-Chlamydomonas_euryale.AAC.2
MAVELLEVAPSGSGGAGGGGADALPPPPPCRHVMTLSADWRCVLPHSAAADPPGAAEFAVCLQAFHRQQLDAARSCGLFATTGRTFQV